MILRPLKKLCVLLGAAPFCAHGLAVNSTDPWFTLTESLSTPNASVKSVKSKINASFAQALFLNWQSDKKNKPLLNQWGMSKNFDESNTSVPIVHPVVMELLHQELGLRPESQDYAMNHAGLTHTYGYLFSNLKTPYGYKRERWTAGSVERGLNLSPGHLSPLPPSGTLFKNVTELFGRVVGLPGYPAWSNPRVVVLETANVDSIPLQIKTVIANYIDASSLKSTDKNRALLVYAIAVKNGPFQLITGFPVDAGMIDSQKKLPQGKDVLIKLRFNSYVKQIKTKEFPGTRSITL